MRKVERRRHELGRRKRRQNRHLAIEQVEKRELLDASDVIISEFLAVNDTGLQDEDGDRSDWIELLNNGDEDVDLAGLQLSDGTDRWTLPSRQLAPSESLIVFASGKDRTGSELHTNFRLGRVDEQVSLYATDGTTVIHEFNPYPPQTPDTSYGVEMSVGQEFTLLESEVSAKYLVPQNGDLGLQWTQVDFDDTGWNDGQTGIGYESSGSNYAPLLNTRVPTGTVGFYSRIHFDANDLGAVAQLTLQMKYDDGFIAYLNGQRVADGNGITNPAYNSSSSGERSDGDAVIFQPFDISAFKQRLQPAGNVLAIHSLNRNNTSSDLLMMPEIRYSGAGGVNLENVGFFAEPTPNGVNGVPSAGFTQPVEFDLPHGFYEFPQILSMTSFDQGVTIRYTTDGSVPTASTGQVYTGPISVDQTVVLRAAAFQDDLEPASITTASYFFVADVAQQTSSATIAAGFPRSWNGTSADYGMDPDVVGTRDDFGGVYANSLQDDLQAIPTLSIVMDIDDMFGSSGIYSNPTNSNLEKAASLELVHPDGTEGFQIDAGIKIQGGAFRNFGLTKKKSFRFKFQAEYGPTKLRYPLFGPDATDSFDTITLRMEANDGWQWSSGDNTNRLYTRDEFLRRTQLAMGQPASHGTFGHVYINGFYWGTYNIVERPDEGFASDYIGGDKEDWDVQNSGRAIQGNLQSWNDLNQIAQQIDSLPDGSEQQFALWMEMQGLLPDGSKHPTAEDLLDVENYIDYLIANFYGGNSDWPFKNYYAGRQRGPDSTGYKFFMWDAEWSLNLRSDVDTNRLGDTRGIASVYGELRRVPEFQLWFADRIQKHFSPGGALYVDPENPEWDPEHPERNVPAALFYELTNTMRSPLVAESARWGDQHDSQPHTVNESWEPQVENLLENYFPERSANMLELFRRGRLLAAIPTPTFSQRGGVIAEGAVSLDAETGDIYYTTDGSDPRLPGGAISPTAVRYEAPVPISGTTHLRVRAFNGEDWSAIDEAVLTPASAVPADASNLAITEIHYHPADAGGDELPVDQDEFEFVELTNYSDQIVNLSGAQFVESLVGTDTEGIRFTFSEQTLAPGESIVVVENLEAFQFRYGSDIRIADGVDQPLDPLGQYGGKLANAGETITLQAADGSIIRQVGYLDTFHPTTDGDGFSLELVDATETSTDVLSMAASWAPSLQLNGTPGQYAAELAGDLNGDGLVDRGDVDEIFAELENGNASLGLDLNGDGTVDRGDAQYLIRELIGARPGDADLDGDIDFADFLILSSNFGKTDMTWLEGDFDEDGTVQFADFLLLSSVFGT